MEALHLPVNPSQVLVLDLAGTFIFALSGGMAGVTKRLDLFGLLALAFVAGNGGGIVRDVLLGAVPPPALTDWRYVAVSLFAGVLAFQWHPLLHRVRTPTLMFDAGGLALFAVSGTQKALNYDLGPVPAVLLGVLTGIGGGVARDILVAEVPAVLREDLYAVAALAAAVVVVLGDVLDLSRAPVTLVALALCFGIRFVSITRGWRLPVVHPHPSEQPPVHAHAPADDVDAPEARRRN